MEYFWAITSVIIVSLISFVGLLSLFFRKSNLQKTILILVAFSTGALIGDATIHLLPESVEVFSGFTPLLSMSFLFGIMFFFSLEKFLRWRHCHDINCQNHPSHLGTMNLVGDGVHNFIDGLIIGSSFLVSIPLGITTTLAVILHEIPQELGDFGILVHSGFKKFQAILYNFFSGIFALVGTLLALFLGSRIEQFSNILIPITAGGFIYIALSGLVPELHKENETKVSIIQFAFILLGIGVMTLLLLVE